MSHLALLGGSPACSLPWPRWPQWDRRDEEAVLGAVRLGEWGGYPMPNVHAERFAAAFAAAHDAAYGLCVANGTVALEVALEAMGVEPGAEVIVPAYTFEATAAAVLFAGCVPVFADVDPGTYCLDPSSVEEKITSRTQAVIAVHLAQRFADLERLSKLCSSRGLGLLEDCAHAHGGRFQGRGAGSFGAAGCFSFQTSKLLSCGEGGIVLTSDAVVLDRLHALVNCGRQRPQRQADTTVVGHNYRLGEMQAALLESQLERLAGQHEIRNRNVARFEAALAGLDCLRPLDPDARITRQAAYQVVLRYDEESGGAERAAVVAALQAEGVPCDGLFYECLSESPLLPRGSGRYPQWDDGRRQGDCPVAWRAAYREAIWLPHQLFLGGDLELEQLVRAVTKVAASSHGLRGLEHPEIERQRVARTRRSSGPAGPSR